TRFSRDWSSDVCSSDLSVTTGSSAARSSRGSAPSSAASRCRRSASCWSSTASVPRSLRASMCPRSSRRRARPGHAPREARRWPGPRPAPLAARSRSGATRRRPGAPRRRPGRRSSAAPGPAPWGPAARASAAARPGAAAPAGRARTSRSSSLDEADTHDLVLANAPRGLDLGLVVDVLADQGPCDGAGHRDLPGLDVGLVVPDDLVDGDLAALDVLDLDGGPENDAPVGIELGRVDDLRVRQLRFELRDAALDEALALPRCFV